MGTYGGWRVQAVGLLAALGALGVTGGCSSNEPDVGAGSAGGTSGSTVGNAEACAARFRCTEDTLEVCEAGEFRTVVACEPGACQTSPGRCDESTSGAGSADGGSGPTTGGAGGVSGMGGGGDSGGAGGSGGGGVGGQGEAGGPSTTGGSGGQGGTCELGDFTCDGDVLRACGPDQQSFYRVATCAPGLCDPVGGQCDVCGAGSEQCVSSSRIERCNADGQTLTESECPSAEPYCDNDACVECRSELDCPAPATPCLAAACAQGACGTTATTASCTVGDDAGTCSSGTCRVCTPTALRCEDTTGRPQRCSADGLWEDLPACEGGDTCQDGACVAAPEPCNTLKLTDQTSRVSLPVTGFGTGSGDFTLELWVQLHGEFAGNRLFSTNENYGAWHIACRLSETGQGICTSYDDSCPCGPGNNHGTVEFTMPTTGWHHLVYQRASNVATVFIDGASVGSDPITVNIQANHPVAIGKQAGYDVDASPAYVGPMRFSNVARYGGSFTPAQTWAVDSDTVALFLANQPFAGTLVDEAGGDNTSTVETLVTGTSCTSTGAAWGSCFNKPAYDTCADYCSSVGKTCVENGCDGFTVWTMENATVCASNPNLNNRFARTCSASIFQADDTSAQCCCE